MKLELERHYIDDIPYTRPSGFITDPNLAALFTGLGSILFLLNRNQNKIIYFVYLLISGFAFTLISSKSAYLVLLLCVIFFLILKIISLREFLTYFFIFYLLPLTPMYNVFTFKSFTRFDYYKDELNWGRVAIWEASLKCFKTSPVIGVGSGVFFIKSYDILADVLHEKEPETAKEDIFKRFIGTGNTPHSLLIAVMVEYGVIGLMILIWFIIKYSVYLFKNKCFISFVIFLGLLVVSSVSSYAPYYKLYYVICIFLYAASIQNMKILKSSIDS